MCDIVDKMLNLMNPYVCNIDSQYEMLEKIKQEVLNLENLVSKTNNVALGLLDIEDVTLLNEVLDINQSSVSEYEANSYILKSPIEEVRKLPQYEDAQKYIERIYNQIKKNLSKLQTKYQELDGEYKNNTTINKYYQMFLDDQIFIEDEEEFLNMIEKFSLKTEEKNLLLIYILKENNKTYMNDANQEEFNEVQQVEIENILKSNYKLLSKEYNELLDVVSEYVDLTKNINEIVNEELLNKININNIMLAKKIWLLKKLAFNYYNLHCKKCSEFVKEFKRVSELLKKVSEIVDKKEAIRIIKGDIDNEG